MELDLNDLDFSTICRLCLSNEECLYDIFSFDEPTKSWESTLQNKILDVTSVQVIKLDGLPSNICVECCQLVDAAHSFKRRCLLSDEKLRVHVNALGDPHCKVLTNAGTADPKPGHDVVHTNYEIPEKCDLRERDSSGVSAALSEHTPVTDFQPIDVEVKVEIIEEENDFVSTDCENPANYDVEERRESSGVTAVSSEKSLDVEVKEEIIVEENDFVSTDRAYPINYDLEERRESAGVIAASSEQSLVLDSQPVDVNNDKRTKKQVGNHKFICTYCSKGFHFRWSLKRHELLHKCKILDCRYCKKTFRSVDGRSRHEKTHKGPMPYHCQYCKKTYLSATSFNAHLRKHTGEKPFQCSECKEKFSLLSTFSRHIVKHRGVKTFVCEICDASFWVGDDLRTHVNRQH